MEINEHHRRLLAMRTYRNKFAIQRGYQPGSPIMNALQELIGNGYVTHIDFYHNLEVGAWLDVYLLTPAGVKLVEDEAIVAVSP